MSTKKAHKFFQSFDRYAEVVSLKYKKNNRFETSAGGVFTIISIIVVVYWVVTNILNLV